MESTCSSSKGNTTGDASLSSHLKDKTPARFKSDQDTGGKEVGYILAVSRPVIFNFVATAENGHDRGSRRAMVFNQWVEADIVHFEDSCVDCFHDERYDLCHAIVTCEFGQPTGPKSSAESSDPACCAQFKIHVDFFNGKLSGTFCGRNVMSNARDASMVEETITREKTAHRHLREPVQHVLFPGASDESMIKMQDSVASNLHSDGMFLDRSASIAEDEQNSDGLCQASIRKTSDHKKRSDVSLLLGTALQSQQLGHIKIESAQILLHHDGEDEKKPGLSARCQIMNATVLLTISIPNFQDGGPFKLPYSRGIAKRSPGGIPSITQLMFNLLDTNWDSLEERLPRLQLHSQLLSLPRQRHEEVDGSTEISCRLKAKRSTIFPTVLSLESLYRRIQDIHNGPSLFPSSHSNAVIENITSSSHGSTPWLQCLSRDLLAGQIAPYLRAKSLYALRCSSKYLFSALDACVPGMKLRLYWHQCKSLNWMHSRESQLFPSSSKAEGCDFYRCGTAGVHLVLSTRHKISRCYYRCNTMTGCISMVKKEDLDASEAEQINTTYNYTRGGLLCDDAGLGKTITVLSIILRTLGQSTHHESPLSNTLIDGLIFDHYWKTLDREAKMRELLSLHNQIRKQDKYGVFDHPVDLSDPILDGYMEVVSTPICMADIIKKIIRHDYDPNDGDGFKMFCSDLYLMFRNATAFHPPDRLVYIEGSRLRRLFERIERDFKSRHVATLRQMLSSKKDFEGERELIGMIAEKKLETLAPTAGTLLVVPKPLLNHWQDQMMQHIDFSYFGCKIPLIFHHGNYDYGYLDSESRYHTSSISDAVKRCQDDASHCNAVFIDHEAALTLPSHDFIKQFYIVVTSVQRLSNAWKNGREEGDENLCSSTRSSNSSVCPFLKVRWLRLVVDEGHTMGKGSRGNAVQFSSWIYAQRRWVMTGTPTPQTNRQSDLRNILGLLNFLQHGFFSSDKIWKKSISKSWSDESFEGYFRLCHLLSLLMRRHTKDSIHGLPPPRFKLTHTELSSDETLAYNTLTGVIKSNLLITGMDAKISGRQDSLLSARHSSLADEALRNVRLSCCGGANLMPTLTEKSWKETLGFLTEKHKANELQVMIVEKFLRSTTTGGTTSCGSCNIQLQQLLLLPCAHLICTECLESFHKRCPIPDCQKEFDADEFQLLQPGFNLTWQWNLVNGSKTDRLNSRRSLVPSVDQPHHDGTAVERENIALQGNASAQEKQQGQNEPIPRLNRRLKKGEPHICRFSKPFTRGLCHFCFEEHNNCDLVNERMECIICYRKGEECPVEESKASLIVRRLLKLIDQQNDTSSFSRRLSDVAARITGESFKIRRPRQLKVIIFSQFRQILNVVGDRLLNRLGSAVVAEYWGRYRDEELRKFKSSPKCVCMLLGRDGSHGLDLSFVTNIIFLDEIYDKSLQHQVIARAYRMGAQGSVEVEQLVAKNSIEEVMVQMNQTDEKECTVHSIDSSSKTAKSGASNAKLHFLLKSLRLIRPESATGSSKRSIAHMTEKAEFENKGKQSRVRFNF